MKELNEGEKIVSIVRSCSSLKYLLHYVPIDSFPPHTKALARTKFSTGSVDFIESPFTQLLPPSAASFGIRLFSFPPLIDAKWIFVLFFSCLNQKFSKRENSAYLPKVKPSVRPLFFSMKTSRDR